jgi:hypothetical protein
LSVRLAKNGRGADGKGQAYARGLWGEGRTNEGAGAAAALQAEQAQPEGWVRRQVALCGGDRPGPGEAKQADGEVSQAGEHLGAVARAHATAVLVEGDIAYPMEAIFNGPVTSCRAEQLRRRGFVGRARSDAADDFPVELARGDDLADAFDLEDLAAVGKREVVVELGAGPDSPGFEAAVALFDRLVLRGEKR